MAKPKTNLPSYYDGQVLNRKRELTFRTDQALGLRGLDLDLAVNHVMNMIEEYELSSTRAPADTELAELSEYGRGLIGPLLARQRAHGSGTSKE